MNLAIHKEASAPKSQAELLFEAQQRKQRLFRLHVLVSWVALLIFLIFLFSSIQINSSNGVTQFSTWSYVEVTQNGIQILKKTPSVFLSLPFGFPGGGINLTTIVLDKQFILDNFSFISGGIFWTLRISFLSIAFATVLALLTALGRLSTFPPIFALSTFYVSLIRGTPLYLQILFFFLALPQLNIKLSGEVAGVLALGLNYGAYMSEIFRAGLSSVGKGQREAAMALGMTPGQTMRRIILPQALRFAIPPMGNDFISMTKDSALVAITGFVHELMWNAEKVGRAKFRNLEALIIAAVFYWMMTIVLSYLQSKLEANLAKGDR